MGGWRRRGRGPWAGMSVPPLLDLASWSPAPTVDSRSSVASDELSPRIGGASSEIDTPSPDTPPWGGHEEIAAPGLHG